MSFIFTCFCTFNKQGSQRLIHYNIFITFSVEINEAYPLFALSFSSSFNIFDDKQKKYQALRFINIKSQILDPS